MSEHEKDWREKLVALKASGTLVAVEKNTLISSVPSQLTPISPSIWSATEIATI